MKKIAVLTSGGDAPGMNAAIRAVTRGALYHKVAVYGIERGFEGLINGEFQELEICSVSDTMQRGGTWLKTARSERFMTPEDSKSFGHARNFEIGGLVIIGGDGSFRWP